MKLKIYPNPLMNTAFTLTWNQPIPIAELVKALFKWKLWDNMPNEMGCFMTMGKESNIRGLYVAEDGHEGLETILKESGFLELGPKGSQKYEYYSSTDLLEVRGWMDNGRVHYGNDSDFQAYNIPASYVFNSLNLPPYPVPVHPAWVSIQKDPRVNATHPDDGSIGAKGPVTNLMPELSDHSYIWYSTQLITEEFDEEAVNILENFTKKESTFYDMLFFGGKVKDRLEDFNGNPMRNEFFQIAFYAPYEEGETFDEQRKKTNEVLISLEKYTSHRSYQGSVDLFWTTDPKIYMPRYYGRNVDRLVKAKAKYDPGNLFSYAQSTPTRL